MTTEEFHFEDLWVKCEYLYSKSRSVGSSLEVLNEIKMKVDVYKIFAESKEVSVEDMTKAKSRLMGEILLSLTHLSFIDNINVFQALNLAQQHQSAETIVKVD
jgi:hypothetical protein